MLTLPTSLRVFAHRFATDMRKSFSGLVGIIESELGQQVESGHLFLFFNRRRDRVKILFFTGDGLMILYRLLERGTFETPRGWRAAPPEEAPAVSRRHRSANERLGLDPEALIWPVKRRSCWRREAASA
jgi:transposase